MAPALGFPLVMSLTPVITVVAAALGPPGHSSVPRKNRFGVRSLCCFGLFQGLPLQRIHGSYPFSPLCPTSNGPSVAVIHIAIAITCQIG